MTAHIMWAAQPCVFTGVWRCLQVKHGGSPLSMSIPIEYDMKRKSLDKIIIEQLPFVDIPLLMFIGAAAGFLIIGTLYTTLAVFAGTDYTPWTCTLLTGLMDIAISACIGGIAWIYWKLVLRKSGVVLPALSGFGLILGLVSLLSAITLGAQII